MWRRRLCGRGSSPTGCFYAADIRVLDHFLNFRDQTKQINLREKFVLSCSWGLLFFITTVGIVSVVTGGREGVFSAVDMGLVPRLSEGRACPSLVGACGLEVLYEILLSDRFIDRILLFTHPSC